MLILSVQAHFPAYVPIFLTLQETWQLADESDASPIAVTSLLNCASLFSHPPLKSLQMRLHQHQAFLIQTADLSPKLASASVMLNLYEVNQRCLCNSTREPRWDIHNGHRASKSQPEFQVADRIYLIWTLGEEYKIMKEGKENTIPCSLNETKNSKIRTEKIKVDIISNKDSHDPLPHLQCSFNSYVFSHLHGLVSSRFHNSCEEDWSLPNSASHSTPTSSKIIL